ncbi:porin family protein [Flavobacterium filum]|uniref:porin family protein n=1 Tax=Flavobacterium TaxID=237 RepID=UPI00041DF9D5|nr:porin family protein [Flavobacterium filum]
MIRILFFWLLSLSVWAQDTIPYAKKLDLNYREDQFYVGIAYNILQNKPNGLTQNKFSTGLQFGFLRDMPINKQRTYAIAAGAGFTYQSFNQDLLISKGDNGILYSIIEDGFDYNKNKFYFLNVDLPIEFRYRTSTPQSHKFFRLYAGFKLSYMLLNQSNFLSNTIDYKIANSNHFTKFQYGVYLATGYNTWNFYAYYGLNPIFNNKAKLNDSSIDLRTLNLGLQFYIL